MTHLGSSPIEQIDSRISIPRANTSGALGALNRATNSQFTTLEDALRACKWHSHAGAGGAIHLRYDAAVADMETFEAFLQTIAPHVSSGSWLRILDGEFDVTGYVFKEGGAYSIDNGSALNEDDEGNTANVPGGPVARMALVLAMEAAMLANEGTGTDLPDQFTHALTALLALQGDARRTWEAGVA